MSAWHGRPRVNVQLLLVVFASSKKRKENVLVSLNNSDFNQIQMCGWMFKHWNIKLNLEAESLTLTDIMYDV